MQKIGKSMKAEIMNEINSGKVKMKPKSYFVLGSILALVGLVASVISSIFLLSIVSFLLRPHGPMGSYRFNLILESFPWYLPLIAIGGILIGILILRKYDFSYKKNIWIIILGFIFSIIFAGVLLDISGLDNLWLKRGPMNSILRQYDSKTNNIHGQGARNGNGRKMYQGEY
jgi:hypothetical protein